MTRTVLMIAAVALSGCMTESSFYSKSAKASCKWQEECLDTFGDAFDSVDECVDEVLKNKDDSIKAAEDAGCEFNAGNASACLKAIKGAECEEPDLGDCEDVYENCGEGEE